MVTLNMLSHNFSHANSSTARKKAKNINWDFRSKNNTISVYIDADARLGVSEKDDGKLKFLWLLESRQYDHGASNFILQNLDQVLETFEEIWTHNDSFLQLHPKFKWSPAYGTYIEDFGVHNKTKKISMITSNKRSTEQHRFRYDFAQKNQNKLDLFGRGFREITRKETGLNDYMFSVAIENDTYDTYFTEKILDCFATGTIPVYKGTKKITEHFNGEGILFLDDIELDNLTEDLYFSKLDAVKENYSKVLELDILEDWIYEKYLKNYV